MVEISWPENPGYPQLFELHPLARRPDFVPLTTDVALWLGWAFERSPSVSAFAGAEFKEELSLGDHPKPAIQDRRLKTDHMR